MALLGAREIKRKIKSVRNTMQITKAMELVSTAKLRKAKEEVYGFRPFFYEVVRSFSDVIKLYPLNKDLEGVDLGVVVTSDRGLCGGYNHNIIKKAEEWIESRNNVKLITVGEKGYEHFSRKGIEIIRREPGFTGSVKYSKFRDLSKYIMNLIEKSEVSTVSVFYTHMISAISQRATLLGILPVNLEDVLFLFKENKAVSDDELQKHIEESSKQLECLPKARTVLRSITPEYVASVLHGALIESLSAEQSARRNAMEHATNNAQELIDELVLSFNQARQSAITQEITEIVGGANALE